MKTIVLLLLAAVSVVISGCVLSPIALSPPNISYASPAEESDAKRFLPDLQNAKLYVYRERHFKGGAVVLQIFLDGRLLGSVGSGSFAYACVAPGRHVVRVITVESTEDVVVEAKPGLVAFIKASTRIGMAGPRAELKAVTEAEGKKAVSEGRMVAQAYSS